MTQATFVQQGLAIDYTPGSDVAAGDVVVQQNLVGIPKTPIEANRLGALAIVGVFDMVKDSSDIAKGASLFWDADGDPVGGTAGSGAVSTTRSGNTFCGFALAAAGPALETVRMILRSVDATSAETLALADLSDITGPATYDAGKLLVADGDSYESKAVSGDATLAASGALTLAHVLTAAIADPGDAGAIPVTKTGTCPLVTAAAETRTLAAPDAVGQLLNLGFKTDTGDCVVTCATGVNQTGNNTLTFAAEGDQLLLVAVEVAAALRWRVICNDGVALSTV